MFVSDSCCISSLLEKAPIHRASRPRRQLEGWGGDFWVSFIFGFNLGGSPQSWGPYPGLKPIGEVTPGPKLEDMRGGATTQFSAQNRGSFYPGSLCCPRRTFAVSRASRGVFRRPRRRHSHRSPARRLSNSALPGTVRSCAGFQGPNGKWVVFPLFNLFGAGELFQNQLTP